MSKVDLSLVPNNILDGPVYEKLNLDYLNKTYIKKLLAYQYFIKNAEEINLYQKLEIKKDTFTYLIEKETQPSFHFDINCKRMTSKFENLQVPFDIQQMGKEKVIEFRNYVTSEFGKYESARFQELKELIITRINFRFQTSLTNLNFVSEDFSGSQLQANPSLDELEREIEKLFEKFQEACKMNTPIFPKFAKSTYLWRKPEEIKWFPYQWYRLDEFLAILKDFDKNIVEPTLELLKEYYKVKFNKDLCFNGELLQELNFKSCGACFTSLLH